tara:strand:+ start:34488 stop:34907 length:420 start_codon:yes stop_codon:yes gene_type:complete
MTHPDRRHFTLSAAAKLLRFGPNKLRALLRTQGVLDANNLPRRQYVQSGDFKVDVRERVGAYDIRHQYAVALVSGRGLTLLRQLIDEHTNAAGSRETASPLRRRDRRATQPGTAPERTGTGATPLPRLGTNPGRSSLRA